MRPIEATLPAATTLPTAALDVGASVLAGPWGRAVTWSARELHRFGKWWSRGKSLNLKSAYDSQVLRSNLEKVGVRLPYGTAAHHIVSNSNYRSAVLSRQILDRYGININSPVNGVGLPDYRGQNIGSNVGSVHVGSHSDAYHDYVFRVLSDAVTKTAGKPDVDTKVEIMKALAVLKGELLEGGVQLR